jgi:hypothetical protein
VEPVTGLVEDFVDSVEDARDQWCEFFQGVGEVGEDSEDLVGGFEGGVGVLGVSGVAFLGGGCGTGVRYGGCC